MTYLYPLFAFFIAATPFGLIIGKMVKGIDIREHGSGNIGTTNVFRVLGKGPGIICLLLDILKGFLPVVLAMNLLRFGDRAPMVPLAFLDSAATVLPASQQLFVQLIHVFTALCAILGHNFSPWLGFKGGKGIATSLGVLIALMPVGALIVFLLFLIVFLISRYVSLASIITAAALPLLTLWGSWHHGRIQDGTWNVPLFVFTLIIGILAIWKHRSNIQRLRAGTENRFSRKK